MARLINPQAMLTTDSVTLGDRLQASTHLIPDYQRDFSWGEDELSKLWADITKALKRSFVGGTAATSPEGHFLGAIVTQQSSASAPAEVIDGQQRLTTVSILISVMLEFAEAVSNQNLRTNLLTQLVPLIANTHGGGRDPRLILARDQDFYNESIVQRFTLSEREKYWATLNLAKEPVAKRICFAVTYFHEHVLQLLDAATDRDQELANLAEVVTGLLVVLHLGVTDHRMAYRVFETLNFRGLDLSQGDLLKNELVRRADLQGSKQAVVANWAEVVKNLERITALNLVEFLQYHFSSKYGPVRASDLFESVVEYLETASLSAQNYSADLVAESVRLAQLVEGDDSAWSAITNQALDEIRDVFGLKFAYPLLMAASARYVNSPSDLEKWAIRVRNFCFRNQVIERNPLGSFEKVMTASARELRDTSTADLDVLKMLQQASPDVVFVDRFGGASASTNKLGFYIVKSIEDHLGGGAGTTLPQGPAQHLEHIMPKKPGQGWVHLSGDARYQDYLRRIGNLLGLEQKINGHIKNKEFDYKNSNAVSLDYQHSKMTMPALTHNYLNPNNQWDFDSIDKRQADLAKNYAVSVWPLS